MSDNQLTSQQSLDIITEMIAQAKKNYSKGGSFYFLLWGWTVVIANLGHFVLDKFTNYPHPYFVWVIIVPAAIISIVYGMKQSAVSGVVTHLDKMYGHIWLAASVGMGFSIIFMNRIEFNHSPVILLIAGSATYISGHLMKFRPLIYGALAIWMGAIVGFMVTLTDQTLVSAISLFIGYLIPGYMLKKKERE